MGKGGRRRTQPARAGKKRKESGGQGFADLDRVILTLGPSRSTSIGPEDLDQIDEESRR